jgi:aspartate kinase
MHSQTSFETERGISSVAVSHGFSLVIVSGISELEPKRRLDAFRILKDANVSLDFLKLSPTGFTFILAESDAEKAVGKLCEEGFEANCIPGRTIITVNAANIRDENGLVARIAQTIVRSNATIEQVGDMHSSVQVVVDQKISGAVEAALRDCIGKTEIL